MKQNIMAYRRRCPKCLSDVPLPDFCVNCGIVKSIVRRKRQSIPKFTRLVVFRRDGLKCAVCRSPNKLTIDHVIPHSRGGGYNYGNLLTMCGHCNMRKKNITEWNKNRILKHFISIGLNNPYEYED